MKHFLLFIAGLMICCSVAHASSIQFMDTSIPDAKSAAKRFGRPLLVVFHTDWSNDYHRMNASTFSNDRVADFVNANFVALLVDVDDFTGAAYKEQYNIRVLPTSMVFDRNGAFLKRMEGFANADVFYEWVDGFLPALPIHHNPIPKESELTMKGGPSLGKVTPRELSTMEYSIQVGAFATFENALHGVAQAQQALSNEVELFVEIDENSHTPYKVMSGRFRSHSESSQYKKLVAAKGINGFVKQLY